MEDLSTYGGFGQPKTWNIPLINRRFAKFMTTDKAKGNNGNLRPFKPGQSGNPKGRPRGTKSIPDILRKIGKQPGKGGNTRLDDIMEKVYALAEKGMPWAVQFVADRMEGKPHQTTHTTNETVAEVRVIE